MNIFVAFFVLLLLLSESTPKAAESIPLIGEYENASEYYQEMTKSKTTDQLMAW